MKPLRILVFSGGPVYPVEGMHQVRIINQLQALAGENIVDFCFLYTKPEPKAATIEGLKNICNEIIPVKTITQSFFFRLIAKLFLKKIFSALSLPYDHFSLSNILTSRKISGFVGQGKYDVVISHYWQASGFLRYINSKTIKCIDTHYLVEENIELEKAGKYIHLRQKNLNRLLENELRLQKRYFDNIDLLIVNSIVQKEIIEKHYKTKVVLIPNGQNLNKFNTTPINESSEDLNLLFYGALSNQFNQKAIRRLIEKIYPIITGKNPEIKLIVMGSNPPDWLLKKAEEDHRIKVTGFVSDIGEVVKKCFCCIIPLDSGSGFRGRVVELMASGIAVVGTNNALQSVEISNGINGLVSDDDVQLAEYVVKLSNDIPFRLSIANAGRKYANSVFSVEATHGRLGNYLKNLVANGR